MEENPIQRAPATTYYNQPQSNLSNSLNMCFDEGTRMYVHTASAGGYSGYSGYYGRGDLGADYRQGQRNVIEKTNVRPGFSQGDFDYYRPGDSVPHLEANRIAACNRVYETCGIVHNIIDFMTDLTVAGLQINHKIPKVQRTLRAWFTKVKGKSVSERFSNYAYRLGTTVAKRISTKYTKRDIEDFRASMNRVDSEDFDDEPVPLRPSPDGANLPVGYTFLPPTCLEFEDPELAGIIENLPIRIKLKGGMEGKLREKYQVELDMKNGYLYLDRDELYFAYYRKDDWRIWGTPIIASILDDIHSYEKMRLADNAAADGVISQVRLWKLGKIGDTAASSVLPGPAIFQKLSNVLSSNMGGGTLDVVWTPDIELQTVNSESHKFFGYEKYKAVLSAIFGGLGIPSSLTGESQSGGTSSASLIQLKALTERLDYGRDLLTEFWMGELKTVCQILGIVELPTISYDYMILQDDIAMKGLLNQLLDRNVISDETVLDRYGENPDLEKSRIKKENRLRNNNNNPQKAGPYFNPQHLNDLVKVATQTGVIDKKFLEELGVRTEAPVSAHAQVKLQKDQEKAGFEPGGAAPAKKMPAGPGGRPKAAKDKGKRKEKSIYSVASLCEAVHDADPSLSQYDVNLASLSIIYAGGLTYGVSSLEDILKLTKVEKAHVDKAKEVLGENS